MWHEGCYKKRAANEAAERKHKMNKENATENKAPEIISQEQIKKDVLAAVDAILAQQKTDVKKWGKAEHVHLIATLAADYDCGEKDEKRDFKAILAFSGIGGNDSQFRQWLAKEGKLSKTAAAALAEYE